MDKITFDTLRVLDILWNKQLIEVIDNINEDIICTRRRLEVFEDDEELYGKYKNNPIVYISSEYDDLLDRTVLIVCIDIT